MYVYSVEYLCYIWILVFLAVDIWMNFANDTNTFAYVTVYLMDRIVAQDAVLAECKIPSVQII